MKTIAKYSVRFAVVLCFLGITSCTDLLNQEPETITHPNVYWQDQAEAEQALAGAYGIFKNAIMFQNNFLLHGEFPARTFMNSQFWIADYVEGSGNYVLAYRENSRNWENFYRTANWAYTIETYAESMDTGAFNSQAAKDEIIGEAAFLRALSYFWIARLWGDAPIVDSEDPLEATNQLVTDDGFIVTIPRSDELEVLQFALDAVNKAIERLEYSSPAASGWAITANKASAEALKAHITLWYASRDEQNNSEMVQQSIDAATSVINNSSAQLIDYVTEGEAGFNDLFIGQSKEGLFEINISSAMNESYRASASDQTPMGLTMSEPFFENETSFYPVLDSEFYGKQMMSQNADRENDIRKELFFHEYNDDQNGYLMKYSHTSPDPNAEGQYARFSESNIMIFRLADIYLLRAEAYTRAGNGGMAVQDLNTIRNKANVPDYTGPTDQTSLMEAIFNERAIEFVGEGVIMYDRIRMNQFEGVTWMNQNRLDKEGYFWPVSLEIISANAEIEQTEYWKGQL